ncbi:MAG TPA: ABC transporter ATP-binding protein [Methylovorus sp.]|nr:ABC transporter ATP-binding protein [Methylovorus sp.]
MTAPLLQLDHIEVIYDKVILAVRNISLRVEPGSVVALLGANGAGKSTTLKAISGLANAERGEVVDGRIYYLNRDITSAAPDQLVELGLVQVLEGRHCFAHLSVEENLLTGGYVRHRSRAQLNAALEKVYHYFPRLKLLRRNQAGYTSGGEQQMVAIGRALMAEPKLVLLDEPSMGLAPLVVEEIFEIVHNLNRQQGVSFLLAEQNASIALKYADYGYIIESGRVAAEGSTSELKNRSDLQALYLGLQAA